MSEGAIRVVAEMAVENVSDGATVFSSHTSTGGVLSVSIHKVANMTDSTSGHKNEKHSHPGCTLVKSDDVVNHSFSCSVVSSRAVVVVPMYNDVKGVRKTRWWDCWNYVSFNSV